MADFKQHFDLSADSLEGYENKVKIPEAGSPKTENDQVPQIDLINEPKEFKKVLVGPSQTLPSISRAEVIKEYKIARQKIGKNVSLKVRDFLRHILKNVAATGNLQLIEEVKDHSNWQKVLQKYSIAYNKLLKDHLNANRKPTNIFPNPDGVFFTFNDWPDLVCEKQDGQESDIVPESIPDFDECNEEVLGTKMPGVTRAKVIEEYKKARLKISQNQSVVLTDLAQDLLANTEYGTYQLVKNFEDNPKWKKAINRLAQDIKKVLKDHAFSLKKPTNVFKDPQGMCFSFSDWPDLVCEKQDSLESDIDPEPIPDFDKIVEVLGPKMPGITRAKAIEEYKKARRKISQNQSVVFADLAYDLLVNTEYDNYRLVNNFEDSPNWMKAINKLATSIKRIVQKDYFHSRRKPTNIFKDPQGLCFSFSDYPDLVCEKQTILENACVAEVRGSKNTNRTKLPYITRATILDKYKKARQTISQNQSIIFNDFAHDLLVNTEHDNYQLIEDLEHNPSWKSAVSQCVKAVKLVLKDHIICMKKSTDFENPDGVSFTFEDWPDLVQEKKPHPSCQSEPVSEACGRLKGQGVTVALSNKWSCKICQEECESRAHLHRHWCLNHKVFKCCGLEFYGREQIKMHHRRHKQKSKKLSAEDKKMLLPQKKSSRELNFTCPVCEKKFVTANSMFKHKRDEHEIMQQLPQFHCSMCNKKFLTGEALNDHEEDHKRDYDHQIWLNKDSPKLFTNGTGHDKSIDNSIGYTDSEMKILEDCNPLKEFPLILRQRTVMEHSKNLQNKDEPNLSNDNLTSPTIKGMRILQDCDPLNPLISRQKCPKEHVSKRPKKRRKIGHEIQRKTDPLKVTGPPKPRINGCDQCEMRFEYKYQLLCHQSLSHKSVSPTGPGNINKNSPALVHQMNKCDREYLTTPEKTGDMVEKVNKSKQIVDEAESFEIKDEPIK